MERDTELQLFRNGHNTAPIGRPYVHNTDSCEHPMKYKES
jgi:hypothetical protein